MAETPELVKQLARVARSVGKSLDSVGLLLQDKMGPVDRREFTFCSSVAGRASYPCCVQSLHPPELFLSNRRSYTMAGRRLLHRRRPLSVMFK